MPIDLSQMSNEELMRIAGQGQQNDVSSLSNDELLRIAGITQKPTFQTEVIAPFTHAASLFASDIPKAIGSRDTSEAGRLAYQEMYPEQQTFGGKALRFGLSIPAFVAGMPGKAMQLTGQGLRTGAEAGTRFIPEFLGKNTLGRMALRAGEFGAGQAAIAPAEGQNYGENVSNAALTGAMVPPAGLLMKGFGKNAVKTGTFVAKTFGGITDWSKGVIKELGSDFVFDPAKTSPAYVGEVVVPEVKQRISGIITEAKNYPVLRNLGLNDSEIKSLKDINPQYRDRLGTILGGDEVNIKPGIESIQVDAKKRFAALMSRVNPNTAIDVKSFYNKLRSNLISQGWLGRTGEPIEKVGRNQVRDQLLSIYGYLNKTIKEPGGYRKNVVNIPEYENLRSALDKTTGTADDRLLFELGGKIRDEAAKVIDGLPKINKMYADAMRLGDMENRGIFTKIMNRERLEKELFNVRNIDRPNQVARIKSVIGDDAYNKIRAYLANEDLGLTTTRPGTGGGVFPGPSGIKKAFLSEAAKNYYKNFYPFTQKIKTGYEILRTGAEGAYQKPAFRSFISPTTQRYMKSRGGFADYGPFGGESPIQKPVIQPGANLQGKQGIVEDESALIEEAKKYKTAEEFVKAQNLYHGTSSDIQGDKLSFGAGKIRKGGQSGGLFLSDTPESAQVFGKIVYQANPEIKTQVIDLTKPEGIKQIKNYIGKTYKTFDGEIVTFTQQDFESMFPQKKADFASLSQFPELIEKAVTDAKMRGIAFNEYAGGKIGKTYQILKGDIPIKTADQLASLWQKAHEQQPAIRLTPELKTQIKSGKGKIGELFTMAGLTAAGTLMAGQTQAEEQKTIGQKNNNPINLKAFDKWYGMIGKDKDGHAVFKNLDLGIRAGVRNLKTHQRENPNQTLTQYLNKFAEKNGTKEAAFVADSLGISADARLKTLDMEKVIIPLAEFESKIKLTPADIKRVNNTSFPKKKFGKF